MKEQTDLNRREMGEPGERVLQPELSLGQAALFIEKELFPELARRCRVPVVPVDVKC